MNSERLVDSACAVAAAMLVCLVLGYYTAACILACVAFFLAFAYIELDR
jgi:hypothetical protein